MGEHDMLGIAVPKWYNGGGKGFIETVLAEQAIGYTGSIVHACQASLTQHIGWTIYKHGSEHLKERYLTPMCADEYVVAQAFTEPNSGTYITTNSTSNTSPSRGTASGRLSVPSKQPPTTPKHRK